jgi:4-hydroxy-tetrahydrodipicolinate synthase
MMAHLDAGRVTEAAAIHRALVPVTDACFLNGNPSSIRYAIRQLGFEIGTPRLPVVEPDEATGAKIMAELRKHALTVPAGQSRALAGAPAG